MSEAVNTIIRKESTIALISGEEKTQKCLEFLKKCLAYSGAVITSENVSINTNNAHCLSEVTFEYKEVHDNLVIVADETTRNLSEETLNDFEEVMIPYNYKNDEYQNINGRVIKYSACDYDADVIATDIVDNEETTSFKMLSGGAKTDIIICSKTILPTECLLAIIYAMVKIGMDLSDIVKLMSEL